MTTGSRPFHPDNIPFDDPNVWDSDEFFSPGRQLPKIIFKAGGGVEFATVFAGLGVPTTISDSCDRLIHTMDAEMSKLIAEHLKRIGVDVRLGSITRDIRRVNGSLEVLNRTLLRRRLSNINVSLLLLYASVLHTI